MRCDEVQLDLAAYLRGDLELEDRAAIQRHLAECPACAEEAGAVNRIGSRLRSGLSEWAEQGVCPPDVMARIETSIRASGKKSWWQSWPAMAGAVATAAALLLILFGQQVGMPEHLAALPIIGPVASHLLGATAGRSGDERFLLLKASDSQQGITLAVSELEAGSDKTRIHFSLHGSDLDSNADFAAVGPLLATSVGAIPFRELTVVEKKGDEVTLEADFGPVSAGAPLTFSIKQVPVRSAAGATVRSGLWQVAFNG